MKKYAAIVTTLIILFLVALTTPEILHKNKGTSTAFGRVSQGRLKNPYLLPVKGKNFTSFSLISYYLMDNAYTHSSVYGTVLDAYKLCERTCPGKKFCFMECSNSDGGPMLLHYTHQNGLSVDFMVPKVRKGFSNVTYDFLGLSHYLLAFDDAGRLSFDRRVVIDFETMAKHILALRRASQQHGVRIKKVIFNLQLKDDLFRGERGRKLEDSGIYFARVLPNSINKSHDDHYHVDFELLKP